MSFLENAIDKPPVVLDIGHAYTKCGFAGDHGPKLIIRSEIQCNGESKNIFDFKSEDELKENLMEFMYRIYYKILNINSRDRKVIIVESVLQKSLIRKILSDILFKSFQITSLFFMPSHLASLYALGISTALVIDCGYEDIQILPIAENYLMTGLLEFSHNSAKRMYGQLYESLKKDAKVLVNGVEKTFQEVNLPLDGKTLEDIALKTCFVTDTTRARKNADLTPATSDCSYFLPNNMVIKVPGSIREFAFESIFTDETDLKGLANMILNVILSAPIDLRRKLADNLVLIGGTVMLNGFKSRLASELKDLIATNDTYVSLKAITEFKFHQAPCFDNYTAWLGAAIFSTLEIIDSLSIQNVKYKDNDENLPDWFMLSALYMPSSDCPFKSSNSSGATCSTLAELLIT